MVTSPMVTALALGVVWVILQDVAALPHGRFLNLDQEWAMFKQIHKKAYASNNTESRRRRVWEANMRMIVQHNLHADRGMHSFRLGINHLGDMTQDEIVDSLNGFTAPNSYDALQALRRPAPANRSASAKGLPQTLDWRLKGFVTPVKNQGRCGSSWAFSSTGALEGQHFRKTGELTSLSAQNLIDCSFTDGNNGCSGGTMNGAFSYIYKNKGINTEQSYPYQGQNEKCRFHVSYVGATDNGFVTVTPQGSEDALKAAVALVGPISVAIDASQSTFHFYKSGVYYDETCKSDWVNHGMLVVGYGHSIVANQEYWLVKNSWGERWGQQGYILMARNRGNACGIASMASYPIVQ